jgi:hypothetical protein
MIKSLFNLTKDVAEIVTAPIEIAADLTRTVTKPVADTLKEIAEEVKPETDR